MIFEKKKLKNQEKLQENLREIPKNLRKSSEETLKDERKLRITFKKISS